MRRLKEKHCLFRKHPYYENNLYAVISLYYRVITVNAKVAKKHGLNQTCWFKPRLKQNNYYYFRFTLFFFFLTIYTKKNDYYFLTV